MCLYSYKNSHIGDLVIVNVKLSYVSLTEDCSVRFFLYCFFNIKYTLRCFDYMDLLCKHRL